MLGVLKPCYSVETSKKSSTQTLKQAEKQQRCMTNGGNDKEQQPTSTKHSISKDQLKGAPLRKEDILKTYTDVFTGIGKFPGPLYKFQLKPNAKPEGTHQEEFQFTFKKHFTKKSGIWSVLAFLNQSKKSQNG